MPITFSTTTPSTVSVWGGGVGVGVVGGDVVLVTLVAARLAASLPLASWIALMSSAPLGSSYATVTTAPAETGDASVRVTVWAAPLTTTPVTDTAAPPARTVKSPGAGAWLASSKPASA